MNTLGPGISGQSWSEIEPVVSGTKNSAAGFVLTHGSFDPLRVYDTMYARVAQTIFFTSHSLVGQIQSIRTDIRASPEMFVQIVLD